MIEQGTLTFGATALTDTTWQVRAKTLEDSKCVKRRAKCRLARDAQSPVRDAPRHQNARRARQYAGA